MTTSADQLSIVQPSKRICRIYNGEQWVTHYVRVSEKRRQSYIYKSRNPESAVLGFAMLGTMKLGEGG